MKKDNKWINLGDLNYFAYGGCLVQPRYTMQSCEEYPSCANMYNVFRLTTEVGENGDELDARLYCIDLDDVTQEQIDEILEICGWDEKKGISRDELIKEWSPETLAKEIVECLNGGYNDNFETYNSRYPGTWQDCIITEKDLVTWMNALGMSEFIPDDLQQQYLTERRDHDDRQ